MPGTRPSALPDSPLTDFSLGAGGKDVRDLERARSVIPPGTRVHMGFLDSEDQETRLATARAVRGLGFVPVPLIAARRLESEVMLRGFLAGLRAAGASESVQVVAGDPAQPRGPYADSASVIGSGLLEEYGVRQVSVAGHPGGHPAVADDVLWSALAGKTAALARRGLAGGVSTQFGFDADVVLAWLAELRTRGISLPVRVGVPGPTGVRRLLAYASWCGVSVNEGVAREYGFSLTDPSGTAGPDRFIRALASGYDARRHGEAKLHFYPFGGIAATAAWISEFRGHSGS
jgi:methylenetetrahydrofolate reductase (NADPH)